MTLDFTQRLKSLDGSELTENSKPVTLGGVAVNALLANYPNEQITGEVKVQRWKLAQKIFSAEAAIGIDIEDVVTIKRLIGLAFGPLVVGQAYSMLNE
jgi:hypothetical protein